MKLSEILEERTYKGDPLETGGTSIQGPPSPAVRALLKDGTIKPGTKVLDYGAGTYARNANFLRENGVEVFAFDPYNGTSTDGWEGVSRTPPTGQKFDLAMSVFVLNVVPEHLEDEIIVKMRRFSPHQIHVTRNLDIFESVKKALKRQNKLVGDFFVEEFADAEQKQRYEANELTDQDIMEFVHFGAKTSRGFQRIPVLDKKGFRLVRKVTGFKVFER